MFSSYTLEAYPIVLHPIAHCLAFDMERRANDRHIVALFSARLNSAKSVPVKTQAILNMSTGTLSVSIHCLLHHSGGVRSSVDMKSKAQ